MGKKWSCAPERRALIEACSKHCNMAFLHGRLPSICLPQERHIQFLFGKNVVVCCRCQVSGIMCIGPHGCAVSLYDMLKWNNSVSKLQSQYLHVYAILRI